MAIKTVKIMLPYEGDNIIGDGIAIISEQCNKCKWLRQYLKCDAFPDGIPEPILNGQFDHSERYYNQSNDITFVIKEFLKG